MLNTINILNSGSLSEINTVLEMRDLIETIFSVSRTLESVKLKWNKEYCIEFLNKIPTKDAEVNPFIRGLTGRDLFAKYNDYKSNNLFYKLNKYKTILEVSDDMESRAVNLTNDILDLQTVVTKINNIKFKTLFTQLDDVPTSYNHKNFFAVDAGETSLISTATPIADTSFLGLSDTPDYYGTSVSDYIVYSNQSRNGLEFIHPTSPYQRLEVRVQSTSLVTGTSIHFNKDELDHSFVVVDRAVVGSEIELVFPPTYNGADIYVRLAEDTTAGLDDVHLVGTNGATVENEPLILEDTSNFVHFVYNEPASKYEIISLHKGI